MKKLFRFQYEPCTGSCYHPNPEFFVELHNAQKEALEKAIDKIVQAHNRLCNNPHMRFGVDQDEVNGLYIGSFMNYGTLDLFTSKSFLDCVDQLTTHVLNAVLTHPTAQTDDCEYDTKHGNLADTIRRAVAEVKTWPQWKIEMCNG